MVAYNPNIPSTGGVPAVQYTSIQSNFASIQELVDINHVDFASGNYGQHTQVQFPAAISPSGPSGNSSVFFPGNFAGSAYATEIGPFFQNASTTLLCGINAFVTFASNGTITSRYNIHTVTLSSTAVYTIKFGTNAADISLPSSTYGVLVSLAGQTNFAIWYELSSVTAAGFTITSFINNGSKAQSQPATATIIVLGA